MRESNKTTSMARLVHTRQTKMKRIEDNWNIFFCFTQLNHRKTRSSNENVNIDASEMKWSAKKVKRNCSWTCERTQPITNSKI